MLRGSQPLPWSCALHTRDAPCVLRLSLHRDKYPSRTVQRHWGMPICTLSRFKVRLLSTDSRRFTRKDQTYSSLPRPTWGLVSRRGILVRRMLVCKRCNLPNKAGSVDPLHSLHPQVHTDSMYRTYRHCYAHKYTVHDASSAELCLGIDAVGFRNQLSRFADDGPGIMIACMRIAATVRL